MGNASKNGSDAEIDALLKDFFKHEVPAEFQQSVNSPQLVSVSSGSAVDSRQKSSWLGLTVVAASLATVALLLSNPKSDLSETTAGTSEWKSSATSFGGAESAIPAAVAKPDVDSDVDPFNTGKGPVELHHKIRIKNVTVPDPETGTEVELFPELEIEIFPIDDEKPVVDSKANDGDK